MAGHTSRMIIFDDGLGQLGPMTDLRAAFEVRTGMYTTAGRIAAQYPKRLAGYWVPAPLAALVGARADAPVNHLPDEELLLCVSGRWGLPDLDHLALEPESAAVEEATGHVVAAHLRRANAEYFLTTGQLHERVRVVHLHERVLYKYPWDVLALLGQVLPHDIGITRLLDAQVLTTDIASTIGSHPVEVDVRAAIGPNVVFDAEAGPIIIHQDVVIRPHCILCGPCSIGPGSVVVDRAHIKANTVIGPVCKVGGEISGTIFQGYANKSHEGHLGDSWVGKWANLGAGTTNSNLLNTYGEVAVRLEPGGSFHRTGQTFLGAIIGDHVKTAILTRLMTGVVLGTGSMIASSKSPPPAVGRFAWLTDEGERTYRYEKFVEVVKAVMARRGKTPRPEYVAAIEVLYRAWAGDEATRAG